MEIRADFKFLCVLNWLISSLLAMLTVHLEENDG